MNRSVIVALSVAASIAIHPSSAHAVCTGGSVGGFTQYLSGRIPDVILTSGVASKRDITPYYVAFSSTGGHCGIFARSTVPGTTVTDTYGCSGSGCGVHPAGEFAAVGSAYPVAFNVIAPNGAANYIPLAFDGSAPPGTQGFLELAYSGNDNGDLSTAFVFDRVPIYVESSTPASGWNRIISTSSNVAGARVILTHPYLDGKSSARVFVSHVYNPAGTSAGTNWDHRLSVEYDATLAKWTIKNVDNAPMATGLGFNFRVDPTAKQVCMPPATTANEFSSTLVVDDYNANNNVWATVIVTPLSGPDHPVAVKYDAPYWGIVYSDGALIPGGACFNVKVIAFSQYINDPAQSDLSGKSNTVVNMGVGEDLGANGANHTIGGIRMLPFAWSSGNSGSRMIYTSNLTPMGWTAPAASDTKNSSLWISPSCIAITCAYPSRRWGVRHEDGTPVPSQLRINVWAEAQSCYPWALASNRFDLRTRLAPKNQRNKVVSFDQAKAIFSDEEAILFSDPAQSDGAERFVLLGAFPSVRDPLVVSWSCDRNAIIRILSARKANANERRTYETRRSQKKSEIPKATHL